VAHIEPELVDPVPQVPRPDEAVDFRERRVSIGNATLYVQEQGHGTPFILIPGGPGNTLQSFHPDFSRAADFARVIYYDPRGVGQSDWNPGGGYSAEQAVDDLDALREALGIDKWVVLGWSFGGLLAQLYALEYPENIAGLMLLSSSMPMPSFSFADSRFYMSEEEVDRIREIYSDGVKAVLPMHTQAVDVPKMRALLFNAFRNGEWKRQHFYKPSRQKMAQVAWHEWLHDIDYNRLVNQSGYAYDLDGVFHNSPIPTLVIEGKWDPTWTRLKPERLKKQFPNAEIVVFESSAHFSFSEEPDRFFSTLRNFIGGLEPISSEKIDRWRNDVAVKRVAVKLAATE
jgi:proline iminopeptidase